MKKLSVSFILLFGFLALFQQIVLAEIMNLKPVSGKNNTCFGPDSHQTKKVYIIDPHDENTDTRIVRGTICQQGNEEYVFASLRDPKWTTYVYNVTDIQSGSTLKFIPETKEMQVFPPTMESILKIYNEELKRKNTLMCLYNKKLKLPKNYKGPNLKPQQDIKISKRLEGGLRYFNPYYRKAIDTEVVTGLHDSVLLDDENDCKEYIEIKNGYYDVTNVPSGSNLVSISGTNKMKVLPTTDDSYNQWIRDKIKNMEDKDKELQENIAAGNIELMVDNLQEFNNILNERDISHRAKQPSSE